jgi:hypothetical protein
MSDDADELRAEIALLRHEISILRAELARQRPTPDWELRERNIDYYGN